MFFIYLLRFYLMIYYNLKKNNIEINEMRKIIVYSQFVNINQNNKHVVIRKRCFRINLNVF